MAASTNPTERPALREGLLLGLTLGLVLLVLRWLGMLASAGTFWPLLSLALMLDLYLLAGLRAAQQTGNTRIGAYAGLLTALVSSLLSLTASFVALVAQPDALAGLLSAVNAVLQHSRLALQIPQSVLIGALIISYLTALCLFLLLGTLAGALGASLGRARHRHRSFA
jgi:hypothetical protein